MQLCALAALAAALVAAGAAWAEPQAMGALAWPRAVGHHGWSAIDVAADGRTFTALTDGGHITTGTFTRDTEGRITAIDAARPRILGDVAEGQLRNEWRDSEGVTFDDTGGFCVSFERHPRVWCYAETLGQATPRPSPREFAALYDNSALEALAFGPDGALYTLPEAVPRRSQGFPIYRYDGAAWSVAGTLPEDGPFQPVGADFGPDGRLYILERQFAPPIGFATRLRRVTLGADPQVETLLTTRVGRHGNLEGLAVWQAADGALWLTMISDDNGKALARSQVVEYRIAP